MLRFTPNTTGDININDLKLALLNHIVSKQKNEDLIIRLEGFETIEDKDEKKILEILNLFSIDYTQVVQQKNNFKYHQQMAMQLLVDKKAFNCFCSDETLENDKQEVKNKNKEYSYNGFCERLHDETILNTQAPFRVRLKRPHEDITFIDSIQGELSFSPAQVDDEIILNQDKSSTQNFASAVDDMLNNITTVIKDEKLILDTPKQIYIRKQIGYDQVIEYIHIPMIQNGDISIQSLIDEGYLPIAIANYIVSLSINAPKDIFSIEEAIDWFDISKLSMEMAQFNIEKLKELNKVYIEEFDNMRLSKIIGYADEDIGKLAKVYLKDCDTTNQIKEKIDMIFSSKENLEEFSEEYKSLKEFLSDTPYFEDLDELKTYITLQIGLKGEVLNKTLYYLLTGSTSGPDLELIYPHIKNYIGEIV